MLTAPILQGRLWVVKGRLIENFGSALDDSAKAIGSRIRSARERAGLTQEALAERIQLSDVSVSAWERGIYTPGKANLRRVAEVLNTTDYALRYGAAQPPTGATETPLGRSNTTGRSKLPPRAYARVWEYLERMRAAEIPEDMIEESERLMVDPLYSKINKRDIRERSEDDLITDIDAAWSWIREVVEREWGKPLR